MTDNAALVERALTALTSKDYETLESLLAYDVVYQNVGIPATRNRRSTMAVMRATRRIRLEVTIHRTAADGSTVLNERTDAIVIGPFRLQFWAFGVFEVRDGRITLWRDYFDFADCARGLLRALVGVLVPSFRRTVN